MIHSGPEVFLPESWEAHAGCVCSTPDRPRNRVLGTEYETHKALFGASQRAHELVL